MKGKSLFLGLSECKFSSLVPSLCQQFVLIVLPRLQASLLGRVLFPPYGLTDRRLWTRQLVVCFYRVIEERRLACAFLQVYSKCNISKSEDLFLKLKNMNKFR